MECAFRPDTGIPIVMKTVLCFTVFVAYAVAVGWVSVDASGCFRAKQGSSSSRLGLFLVRVLELCTSTYPVKYPCNNGTGSTLASSLILVFTVSFGLFS